MTRLRDFFNWLTEENEFLGEIQRTEREGLPKVDRAARIGAYKKFGYIAHFGNLGSQGRFKVDYETRWSTPYGVYGYPLDIMNVSIMTGDVPHGRNEPFIYILKIHRPEKLLNCGTYTESQFNNDLAKIKQLVEPERIAAYNNDWQDRFESFAPPLKILHLTENLTADQYKWSALLRKIGYVGIYDPGLSLIDHREPIQAVVFNADLFEIVDQIRNGTPSNTYNNRDKMGQLADTSKDPKILLQLAFVQSDELPRRVIDNPNTPPEVLEKLAKHYNPKVRLYLAKKKQNIPFAVHAILSKDPNEQIRRSLAWNATVPLEVVQSMLDDSDSAVRQFARRRIENKLS